MGWIEPPLKTLRNINELLEDGIIIYMARYYVNVIENIKLSPSTLKCLEKNE